jgi:hypothetical protein
MFLVIAFRISGILIFTRFWEDPRTGSTKEATELFLGSIVLLGNATTKSLLVATQRRYEQEANPLKIVSHPFLRAG